MCIWRRRQLTINGKNVRSTNYDQDLANTSDEDRNGFPGFDPIIGLGIETAVMHFYAFADDNRMPIRRIMIDWADGPNRTNENVYGLYKNRKPFCSTDDGFTVTVGLCGESETELTGMTCRTDDDCPFDDGGSRIYRCFGDIDATVTLPNGAIDVQQSASSIYQSARFGNAARACTAEPFEFRHDYSCGQSDIADADNDGDPDQPYVKRVSELDSTDAVQQLVNLYGLTSDSFVCAFQPRVQVLDNWVV